MKAKMGTSESMVKCAFAEFIGCWSAGGEATLLLSTKKGNTTFTFATSLGSPGAPLHPPLPSLPRRRRRRGPARQKRDQQRAACHQATLATSLSSSSSSIPLTMAAVVAPAEEERSHTCKRCKLPCKGHPAPGPGVGRCQVPLDTPCTPTPLENLREGFSLDHTREELVASPNLHTTREEVASPTSSNPCWNCSSTFTPDHQCGDTSCDNSVNDFRVNPDTIKAEWKKLIKEIADLDYKDKNYEKSLRHLRLKKFDLNDLADKHSILLD